MPHARRTARVYRYTAVFEPDGTRGYTVTIPMLPGCISEGDTFEEALANIREAASLYMSVLRSSRRRAPREHRPVVIAPLELELR